MSNATHPLCAGAFAVVGGVISSVLGADDVAAVLTLAGLAMTAWGLHRLGRLGSDPPEPRRAG